MVRDGSVVPTGAGRPRLDIFPSPSPFVQAKQEGNRGYLSLRITHFHHYRMHPSHSGFMEKLRSMENTSLCPITVLSNDFGNRLRSREGLRKQYDLYGPSITRWNDISGLRSYHNLIECHHDSTGAWKPSINGGTIDSGQCDWANRHPVVDRDVHRNRSMVRRNPSATWATQCCVQTSVQAARLNNLLATRKSIFSTDSRAVLIVAPGSGSSDPKCLPHVHQESLWRVEGQQTRVIRFANPHMASLRLRLRDAGLHRC